jgi:hypothetical protein
MRISDLHKRILAQNQIDVDAQAFLTATGITDATITTAINTLVKGLKSNGLWTKMKAVYPFVGGTAFTHKFNLKDPRDLNAAFRLEFFGGWTHTSNGAQPNGTTGRADTFFTPSTNLSFSSAHFSKYNRNNDTVSDKIDGVISNFSPSRIFHMNYSFANGAIGDSVFASYVADTTTGLFITSRMASNLLKVFRRGIQVASNTSQITVIPTINFFLGCRNNRGSFEFFNSYESAFASLGDGLSDSESLTLSNLVQAFQTTLGRQV